MLRDEGGVMGMGWIERIGGDGYLDDWEEEEYDLWWWLFLVVFGGLFACLGKGHGLGKGGFPFVLWGGKVDGWRALLGLPGRRGCRNFDTDEV